LKRQRKVRLTYVDRSPEQVNEAIRAAVFQGGVLWDYFSGIIAERVFGPNEFERGVAEGMRALANEILTTAMSKPDVKVQVTQEE
jgi:hypothetical protein